MKLDLPKAGQLAEKLRDEGIILSKRPLTLNELADLINAEVSHE